MAGTDHKTAAPTVAPRGCTNLKLRQLSRAVTRHYDAYVASTGLKNTQYSLLSHVVLLGPIRPGDLAAQMRLDASTLTQVTELEGFVADQLAALNQTGNLSSEYPACDPMKSLSGATWVDSRTGRADVPRCKVGTDTVAVLIRPS